MASPSSSNQIRRIPLDRERAKDNSEIFGRDFYREVPADQGGRVVYSVAANPNLTIDYVFDKAIHKELTHVLEMNNKELGFSLGHRGRRLLYSLLWFARNSEGAATSGSFSIGEVVRLWESKKSGKLHQDIRQTFVSLASFNPHFCNNKSGSQRREWGYAFISDYEIIGEGDKTLFKYTLNEKALGDVTVEWLKGGEISPEHRSRGYISYEVKHLKEGGLDPRYENFIERVWFLKGGRVMVKFSTILKDWIKCGNDMLRQRQKCHDLVLGYLELAKEKGEIKDYRAEILTNKDWLENWRVIIEK